MRDTRDTLLHRLRDCDAHDAWKEFYELYWGAILRYARKLGLSEHQSHEVLQETMVALMRILPQFAYNPEKGRFRNFLLTIVHRKSLAAMRRARVAQDSQVPLESAAPNALRHAPHDEVEGEAKRRWKESLIEEALRQLRRSGRIGERTFAVFEAYVLLRRPVEEVAAEFGMQENAVYQIKNRCLRRLRAEVALLARNSGDD